LFSAVNHAYKLSGTATGVCLKESVNARTKNVHMMW